MKKHTINIILIIMIVLDFLWKRSIDNTIFSSCDVVMDSNGELASTCGNINSLNTVGQLSNIILILLIIIFFAYNVVRIIIKIKNKYEITTKV